VQARIRSVVTRNMTAQTAELEHEDGELRKKFASEGITMTAAKREDVVLGEQLAKESWEAWAKARGPEAVDALAKARAALGR
jgi:TRAP-type C4-dicarboxylate transport system substrate-binding protein